MSVLSIIEQWAVGIEQQAANHVESLVQEAITHEQPEVGAKVQQLRAAGVSWLAILQAMLPFVMQLLTTKTIDWSALIAALDLLLVPTPTPPVPPNPAPAP
jgi:hypothetical protein